MNPTTATTPSAPAGDNGNAASGSVLADTTNKIKSSARDATAKVKSVAAQTTAQARDHVTQLASEKKETAARRLDDYGAAIHDTAQALEAKDPNIAWFTHRAAERLDGVAEYLRSRDFAGLRNDAEGLARRHPAAFFGGMFFAGLVLGNVVKASRRKVRDDSNGDRAPSRGRDTDDSAPATMEDQPPQADLSFSDLPSATL